MLLTSTKLYIWSHLLVSLCLVTLICAAEFDHKPLPDANAHRAAQLNEQLEQGQAQVKPPKPAEEVGNAHLPAPQQLNVQQQNAGHAQAQQQQEQDGQHNQQQQQQQQEEQLQKLQQQQQQRRQQHNQGNDNQPGGQQGTGMGLPPEAGENSRTALESACEHLVWQFKVNLTLDERFEHAVQRECADEMSRMSPMKERCHAEKGRRGYFLSCMFDFVANMTETSRCRQFLERMERLAFSDFQLVGPFVDSCSSVIDRLECGSVGDKAHSDANLRDHSQGKVWHGIVIKQGYKKEVVTLGAKLHTVELHSVNPDGTSDAVQPVIDKNGVKLDQNAFNEQCRHEMMRLAELQAEDFHLNRPLYFACRLDRERYCKEVQAGEGKVFQCLLENKHKPMEPRCVEMLNYHESLMGMDYKISHPLTEACSKEIQENNCGVPRGEKHDDIYLAYVVLCLDNVANAFGDKSKALSDQCDHELTAHRSLLMTDYRVNPDLVLACANDIRLHCGGKLIPGGNTMHCLMWVASEGPMQKPPRHLRPECSQAVAQSVKAANPGANYKVDRVLLDSCREVIEGPCRNEGEAGQSETLQCLMRHLDEDVMTDDCEDRLLEVQYFIARDWRLDVGLFRACHDEAVAKCHAPREWYKPDSNTPDAGPVVLSCLYRHAYSEEKEEQLTGNCAREVHRVLRERAVRVNLLPDVEAACRDSLAEFCSDGETHNQPNGELMCLQEHMEEIRTKSEQCYEKVEEMTVMESKDVKLNRALTKACRPVIQAYCTHVADEEIDHGDVMRCLVEHKAAQEMTHKCHEYVHHFELISMRDYHFSPRFKKACEKDIKVHCTQNHITDKAGIVRCLSDVNFLHRVLGAKEHPGLEDVCRKMLKVAFLDVEHADAMSNKALTMCKVDIRRFNCYKDGQSTDEVVECLRENKDDLDVACKKVLFGAAKFEAEDNSLDLVLKRTCSEELRTLCSDAKPARALNCLRRHHADPAMSPTCWHTVETRLRINSNDIRLMPDLLHACKHDLKLHCEQEYKDMSKPGMEQEELQGRALACLRAAITMVNAGTGDLKIGAKVQPRCKDEIHRVILESEIDPQLDHPFYKACQKEIERLCSDTLMSGSDHEGVLECMKAKYYENFVTDANCRKQLARKTSEVLADIHLDPVLHGACALDMKHLCDDVPSGEGRKIRCMLMAMESTNVQLSEKCRVVLFERKKLWDFASASEHVPIPQSLGEFMKLANTSPASFSIWTYLACIVLVIFVGGLCFGRVTKRVTLAQKVR